MAKDKTRSGTSSRALRRLEPYNASPGDCERSRNRSSRSRQGSSDSTREQVQTTQEPPSWAKELLEQQKQYSTELKKIKKDLEAAKRSKQEKPNESEPEFKFEGNRDLKIEVIRHFPRTANVKKSRDHCVGVRFAV